MFSDYFTTYPKSDLPNPCLLSKPNCSLKISIGIGHKSVLVYDPLIVN